MLETLDRFTRPFQYLLVGMVLASILVSFYHARAVQSVSIQLLDGVEERRDHRIPLLHKEEEALPDYQLDLMVDEAWHTVGTVINQSAVEPIVYPVKETVNVSYLQRLRIIEADGLESDLLEEIAVEEESGQGHQYAYSLETGYSFGAGVAWFFKTPVGRAILTGIIIVVVLTLLSSGIF